MYKRRTPPEDPPCETCRVDLFFENKEAAEVFLLTRNQYVTAGMGQVVDISIPSVKIAMDLLGVKNQKECLSKVRDVFYYFLKKDRAENS